MDLTVGLAGSGADRIVAGTAEDEVNQALAEVGAAGGGRVTLLQGTYFLASTISITHDNITLAGAGAGQCILQTIPTFPFGSIIAALEVDNFTIQDLTVDGHTNATRTNGIVTNGCSNGVIANCEVLLSEAHNYGIWLVRSEHIQVLDNRVDGFARATGQEGIETWGSDNVLISGNTIENIGGSAINLASVPTASAGDIEDHNTNIQVLDNIVDNAVYGTTVGVAGPRSFGQIEIQGNKLTNVIVGVRLYAVDGMEGAPASENATVENPQSLHDINISNNQISLLPGPGFGIWLQNTSSPDVVSFSNINASDNVISDAPGEAIAVHNFDHFTLDNNVITGIAQNVTGSLYNDTILGSDLANVLSGGAGADTFLFDLTSLPQSGSGVVDHILDYNRGNSGIFNPAEGDVFDFSAVLSGGGQPVANFVRVLDDQSGPGAILQIDQDGTVNGARWTTIAVLDDVQAGQVVAVKFNSSQPAAILTVVAPAWHIAAAADFNGDHKADIVWRDDLDLPSVSTMNGPNLMGSAVLQNVGPTWHVEAAADFNGDGKADILWQHDSGLPAIWTMNGSGQVTASATLVDIGPTWHVEAAADFNGDGKADILWQNDNGRAAIWTMNGGQVLLYSTLPDVGGSTWDVAAAADFNGDGKADILWQNDSGQPEIWIMNGSQVISRTTMQNVGPTWHVEAAADFNGDGKADILWQNDSGLPAIWTMNGGNPVAYAHLANVGPTWDVAAAADFNGDGKADILWQNESNDQEAMWTMNGSRVLLYSTLSEVGSDWHLV